MTPTYYSIMKRFIVLVLCLITLLLSSCSKEKSLAGTRWLGAEGGSTMELTFTDTNFELYEIWLEELIMGRYVYEAPNVTFIATAMSDSDGNLTVGGGSFTGVVNGKVMTVTIEDMSARFIKQ